MSQTPYIFEVTDATFGQLVIENSFHKPVLVDFWAEWCAPCKALMPVLAKIAGQYQGELLLGKLNCDAEPMVMQQLGIRNLPTVVLFRNGQPVDGFSGAQPESAILAMLEPHISLPASPPEGLSMESAQALFDAARFAEAEQLLKQLLTEDNTSAPALILYARCLAERGALAEAEAVLDAVTGDEHRQALAGARAQLTFLRKAGQLPEPALLKARLAQNPGDDEALYQLAIQQLARQHYEPALDGLLQLFIRNRHYGEGLPQQTLLQVFDLLGNDHPLTGTWRRRLYQAIY